MRREVKNNEIRKLIETNIYVFKENFKIMLLSLVEQYWSRSVSHDNLDNFILRGVNRAPIDEIIEVEDENLNTESVSLSATNQV